MKVMKSGYILLSTSIGNFKIIYTIKNQAIGKGIW